MHPAHWGGGDDSASVVPKSAGGKKGRAKPSKPFNFNLAPEPHSMGAFGDRQASVSSLTPNTNDLHPDSMPSLQATALPPDHPFIVEMEDLKSTREQRALYWDVLKARIGVEWENPASYDRQRWIKENRLADERFQKLSGMIALAERGIPFTGELPPSPPPPVRPDLRDEPLSLGEGRMSHSKWGNGHQDRRYASTAQRPGEEESFLWAQDMGMGGGGMDKTWPAGNASQQHWDLVFHEAEAAREAERMEMGARVMAGHEHSTEVGEHSDVDMCDFNGPSAVELPAQNDAPSTTNEDRHVAPSEFDWEALGTVAMEGFRSRAV